MSGDKDSAGYLIFGMTCGLIFAALAGGDLGKIVRELTPAFFMYALWLIYGKLQYLGERGR